MPQISKKLLAISFSIFTVLGLIYYFSNSEAVNNFTQGVFASNPPAVVDVKLKILSDGTSSPQAFDATTPDNSALTDPGDDQNGNNQVVRAGDNVVYEIQINAINMNTTDSTGIVVLDTGKWLSLPSACLTTTTTPAVSAAKASSISADGRTLTCNTGIIVEGTATFVDVIARADNVANNTPLNANASASSTGSVVKTAPVVTIAISARPTVDLVKYVDSYKSGANTIYEPAFIRDQCNTAGVLTPATTGGVCATGVYGDVIIYKFKFQHSRLGDEQLTSPLNVTLDDTFNYGTGNLGANNATLISCNVVPGYTASSGSIACPTTTTAGLVKSTVVTVTGLDDTKTGIDGIIGNYAMNYFVPRADFAFGVGASSMNTSNLITARSSAAAVANEAGWDPNSVSGVSNYGTGATEKTSTCNTDPGSGNENAATCNNRVALTLNNIPPGFFCADKIDTQISAICSTGFKSTQVSNVVPNQVVKDIHIGFDSFLSYTNSAKVCSVVTTDAAGTPLYNFTGNLGESTLAGFYGTWQQRSKNYVVSFNSLDTSRTYRMSKNDDGSITTSYYAPAITGDNNYHDFSAYAANIPASLIADITQTFNSVVIEFSTDPVPPNNKNSFECDTGTWKTYTGDGSITGPATKVRAYVKNFTKATDMLYYGIMLFPEVKISGNVAALAANGNVVNNYAVTKAFDASGNQVNTTSGVGQNGPNNWTISNGGAFGAPGLNTTFKSMPLQDLMQVVPAIIKIAKSNDKPVANAGDTVNYTLTPTYLGGGSSTITVTDTLPAGLTFVAGSYPSICTVAGQKLTCVYTNATAGSLSPATITYKATVSLNATNGDFANFAEISSSTAQVNTDSYCTSTDPASSGSNQCQAASLIQVRTPGAYYIEKRLTSPQVDEVDQDLKYDLTIKNLGSKALGAQEYIEVFPFNGDNGNYTNRVSNPSPSSFSGTVEYKGITLPAGVTVTAYTTDAPGTIKLDPKCKSNTTAANWLDGTPTISVANPQGTDLANYCGGTDTATNWILSSTPPANATAIKLSSAVIAANATPPIVSLVLHTKNNHEGDRYTNNFSGRATTIDLPVVSNDVTSTVIDGSIGDLVWSDDNKNGVQDAGEKGFANVPVSAVWYGPDGILGTADDMTFTATTDSNGMYVIKYLPSGKYDVTVTTPPTGYAPTYDTDGVATPNIVKSVTLTKTTDVSGNVTSVQDNTNTDFGYAGYKIEGDVYVDLNKDLLHGVLPSCSTTSPLTNECGIPSVVVSLLDSTTGAVVQTTTTDALGHYKFTNIPNGTYNIVETQPNAYTSENTNIMPVTMAGVDLTGKDFAELTSTFSGYVYVDSNNDGVKDTGEAGISGVTIKLTGTDVDGNVVSFSTTTDSNGLYTFPNLRAGNYNLMELQPNTYGDGKDTVGTTGGLLSNDMISNITLTPGANSTKNNFGEMIQDKVKLSGTVWSDTNGDGVLDSSENTRLAGVRITVTDLLGNVIGTTVTDSNGYYQMIVNPGTYIITETQPTGYGSSTPNVLQAVVTTDSANNNFGENTKGSISGVVYVDKNNNGVQDPGENGIPSTTVTLSNGTVVKTNSAGAYVFPNLVAGTYDITETQPNYVDGKDTSPVGVVTNDKVSSIPVSLASDTLGVYFGELGGSITGNVFVDADKSTVKNGSETNLPNVVITLKDSSGNVVATTTTDSSGNYKFDGLALGTYSIVETQPDGYASTTPDTLSATVSSSSKDVSSLNYGEIQAGKIKGVVYYDPNKNGVKDPTENTGIAGATIQVKDSAGNVVATVMTDSTGNYEVGGLPFGTYTVSVKEPTGWVSTTVEVVSGTVSTVNLVVNFGAVKDLAKTGADYTMILIGLGMMGMVILALRKEVNFL